MKKNKARWIRQFTIYSVVSVSGMMVSHYIPRDLFPYWVLTSLLIGHLVNLENYKTKANLMNKKDLTYHQVVEVVLYWYDGGNSHGIFIDEDNDHLDTYLNLLSNTAGEKVEPNCHNLNPSEIKEVVRGWYEDGDCPYTFENEEGIELSECLKN